MEARIEVYDVADSQHNELDLRYGLVEPTRSRGKYINDFSNRFCGAFFPDHWVSTMEDGDIVLCILCVSQEDSWGETKIIHHCLVVFPSENPGQYRRVGLAYIWGHFVADPSARDATLDRASSRIIELI
jgi:hypothetical protein